MSLSVLTEKLHRQTTAIIYWIGGCGLLILIVAGVFMFGTWRLGLEEGVIPLHGEWELTEGGTTYTARLPGRLPLRTDAPDLRRAFRFRFPAVEPGRSDDFLYLGPVHGAHEAYLNGRFLGGAGSLTGGGFPGYHRPRVYQIPEGLLRTDDANVLELKVRGLQRDRQGPLGGVLVIGPHRLVKRMVWQQGVAQVGLGLLLLGMSLFFLVLARVSRHEPALWAFALGTGMMGVMGLLHEMWIWAPEADFFFWQRVWYVCAFAAGPTFAYFFTRGLLRRSSPSWLRRLSPWLMLYPVVLTLCLLPAGIQAWSWVDRWVNDPFLLLLVLVMLVLIVRHLRRGGGEAWVLAGAILVFLLAVVAEIVIARTGLPLPRTCHFLGLVVFIIAMGYVVARRLARLHRELETANRELSQLNRELEDRVGRRTRQLADANRRLREHQDSLKQRNAEQRELLHILCHDLANPVGAVTAAVDLLEQNPDRRREIADIIARAGRQALATIDLVRRMRSVEERPLTLVPVNLARAVDETVRIVEQAGSEKGVEIASAIDPELRVYADRVSLVSSVLANLLTNAIKFSHPGGRVDIRARTDPKRVLLEFTDAGVGMDAAVRENLFDVAANVSRPGTAGEEGTGFGMPLVAKFMHAYGGAVEVDSAPAGEGRPGHTTVTLVFQRCADG